MNILDEFKQKDVHSQKLKDFAIKFRIIIKWIIAWNNETFFKPRSAATIIKMIKCS